MSTTNGWYKWVRPKIWGERVLQKNQKIPEGKRCYKRVVQLGVPKSQQKRPEGTGAPPSFLCESQSLSPDQEGIITIV